MFCLDLEDLKLSKPNREKERKKRKKIQDYYLIREINSSVDLLLFFRMFVVNSLSDFPPTTQTVMQDADFQN